MRKPRELKPEAMYHVTARANRKEMIFETDSMKELFLEVLRKAKSKYRFKIENFCIMGNHYHLMIRPGKGTNLSRLMQWVMSVFAMAFNRRHHLVGHVWGERFFSKIIKDFHEYMRVFEYIDANPVRAHQVENANDWRFGALWLRRQGFIDVCGWLDPLYQWIFPMHTIRVLPG